MTQKKAYLGNPVSKQLSLPRVPVCGEKKLLLIPLGLQG